MNPTFVVISGLPGAGKTTVAKPLAEQLGATYLGQDDLMEAIFETVGVRDHQWARTVSQAAMKSLFELAPDCRVAVLDAWWHRWTQPLRQLRGTFVEIFCDCDPAVAADRGRMRKRHPGHFDELNDWAGVASGQSVALDLGGPLLRVDTSGIVDVPAIVRWVERATS